MELSERYRGALFGLAVGDVLETTLEFKAPRTLKPITDVMRYVGSKKNLPQGVIGDVGSKATCQRRRRSGTSVLTRNALQYSHYLC
jgi:ADP-ribosyl-[dinitrogen reductase] hydrolase